MADQHESPAPATVTVDAVEGDVVHVHVQEGQRHVQIDRAETRRRTQHAQAALTDLNAGRPEGEVNL